MRRRNEVGLLKSDFSRIKTLFAACLYISAFTFGGGFVIVTLMKRKFVDELHWINETEMMDLTALAQSCPGAIAVNAAILVGWRAAGFWGVAAAVLGTIVPPIVILSVISLCYGAFAANPFVALVLKGMKAAVAAVILDVVCSLGGKVAENRLPLDYAVMAAAFLASYILHVNAVWVLLAAAAVGLLRAAAVWRKGAAQ